MQVAKHIIERVITSKEDIFSVDFSVMEKSKRKNYRVLVPKDNTHLLLGDKDLAKYADYLAGEIEVNNKILNLGLLSPHLGDLNCSMCEGLGVVSEGENDDIREVPCPCTISEEADFSGATEGDR